jgi:hypothetical protein
MFGYLFLTKELLTLPERKIFRNYVCTLCLAHQYRYGKPSALLNNYDMGVFAIVLNLYGDQIENCGKCGKHVVQRRSKFTERKWGDIVDYNINLVRKKMEDDLHDKSNLKAKGLFVIASGIFKKTRNYNPFLYDLFDEEFDKFLNVETKKPGLDEILDTYDTFARNTFCVLNGVKPAELDFFASLNRWIYWIDAVQDYDEDIKNGSYNPLIREFRSRNKAEMLKNNMSRLLDDYEALRKTINTAYCRIEYPRENRIILENIIQHTIKNTTKLILENGSIPKRRRLL